MLKRTHRLSCLVAALVLALAATFAFAATPARADTAHDNSAYGFFEWFRSYTTNGSAAYNDSQAALDILTTSYTTPETPDICDYTHFGSAEDASSLYNLYPALTMLEEINNYRKSQGKSELKTNCAALAEAINQCNWFSVNIKDSNAYTGPYAAEVTAYEYQNPLDWWADQYGPTEYRTRLLGNFNVAGIALHFDGTNWESNASTMTKGASWDVQLENVEASKAMYTVSQMKQWLATYIETRVNAGMPVGRWVVADGHYYLRLWDGLFANDAIYTMNGNDYGFGGDSILYVDTDATIKGKHYHFGKNGVMVKEAWVYCADNKEYHYAGADGAFLTSTWKEYNGNYFYLDKDGTVATNVWIEYNGKYYFLGSNGLALKSSWIKVNGVYLYLGKDGAVVTNDWVDYLGESYYLKSNGTVLTDAWTTRNGKFCYVGSDGKMLKSTWLSSGKYYYYVGSDGYMVTNGWAQYNGVWYYLGASGTVQRNTWVTYNGKDYFLGADGKVYTNAWIGKNGDYYFLGDDGQPLTNQWKDGYYLGPDGKARLNP